MVFRSFAIAACTLTLLTSASPQDVDRDAYAREHVRFLVLQLDQWSTEFPQQFYAALMRPPVDSSKLSEAAKAGPGELGEAIKRLAALSRANDLLTSSEFRSQLGKAIESSKEFNQSMSAQRFPTVLQSSWDQLRSTLNNLARVYKLGGLAVLEPPAAARRRSRRTWWTWPRATGSAGRLYRGPGLCETRKGNVDQRSVHRTLRSRW